MNVLVVGARGGIGSATVRSLDEHGWRVLGCDVADGVDAADADAVGNYLSSLDVSELSGLVVVAGYAGVGGVDDCDMPEWHQVIRANLDTANATVRGCLPALRAAGDGASIVLMSSVNGRSGGNNKSGPGYAAAKAGVVALARNLARELGPRIRVNSIAPGPVATPMLDRLQPADLAQLRAAMPTGRLIEPEEIAESIAFLLSSHARSITGAVLDINGGLWMG